MTTTQEIIIRDAEEFEQDAIAHVMLEAYQQYGSVLPEQHWLEYRDSIRNSAYSNAPHARIVALLGSEIVGSVQMYLSSEAAYSNPEMSIHSPIIRLLAVSPTCRGRGVATLLIQEAARRSILLGYSTLNLHTSDMMANAIQLYERLGFQRAYETDMRNGETLVKGYQLDLRSTSLLEQVV
jgi:GNAT superfamily N-acetyltransferase